MEPRYVLPMCITLHLEGPSSSSVNTEAVISSQLLLVHGRVSMQLYVNNLKLVYKWRNTAKQK